MALALILNYPPPGLHRDCMLTSTGLPESSFTDFETFIVRVLGCLVAVVESVRDAQGTVHIFSSMHVSGEQLQNLSGVAAVLRFPLPDIEDMEL